MFDFSTIERMSGHFRTLLSAIVANPVEHIGQLPLLTASEQQQLLVEWNNTQVDYPSELSLPELFEAQVERTLDAVAVVYENQQVTYSELNAKANQLAHYLRSIGVGADVLVGICVERSVEMVVGILGILKAGGAYVPIDPEYPTERLSFILEDAAVRVLLTQQSLLNKLPECQAQLVCLDAEWQAISQLSQDNSITGVQAANLAYVIYTSGSTGLPKGVLIPHGAIANHCCIIQQAYALGKSDRVLQFASINFDASLEQIFPTLIVGATLVLRGSDIWTPTTFQKIIADFQLTVVNLPTAYWQQLAQESVNTLVLDPNSQLRLVLVGGDVMLPSDVALWQQSPMSCARLFNAYGPTETTITATLFEILPQLSEDINLKKIPIGRPLINKTVYILDSHLQPVPVGVPGEMYIGGASLATGYLNRSELTLEKFIPNPFSADEYSRLYKTGDLARYLPSGNIEYLGRLDNQVKIRGFRIELGEIEATLSQHPQVHSVVVIARVDNPGDKRLVAYVVPQLDVTLTISVLRQFLQTKLPDYMVPSAIVILESLPLTPNGKVDRRALPAPELCRVVIEEFVAPRTPMEEILAHNWAQVLKLKLVGIHDNFFTLGGHSLLATQLISRIRTHLQVELPLRSLFAAPTVAELAPVIIQLQQQDLQLSTPPILPRASNASVPLSKAQQRLWFLDQYEPNSALYNIPGAWRLVGTLDVSALEQSLTEIIARHSALRTNVISVSGQPVQMIHPAIAWTLAVVDYEDLPTHSVKIATEKWLSHQARQPFDLATGALVRATLLVLSPSEHLMLVCMHHIISDGWSMGVFFSELAALYNAYSTGDPSPLAPLPIEYADFAIWQRQWLTGDLLQTQLAYWQKQLASAPALLSLPTDRPRPKVQTFSGANLEFTLSVELTERLTQLSQQLGATLFMTLLAGFDTLLYRYTGVSDILVGTPIANRNHPEIESLIGFFVNTIVLRTDLSDNPTFSELLERVRAMALSAYAHQDLPFEMLVEALQPERDLSYTPLFQVMFVLQNAPNSTVELTGLSVSPLSIESPSAKFDLTLSMQNTETGLVGVWEYNTDLFDSSTIERMSDHFVTLLEGIVANPVEHIGQLPLLTAEEQQQLLVEWNNTQTDYPSNECIHSLFEAQMERTPDAVALVYENQQLSYSELNTKANQLAHYLRSLGVEADVLVGICVERSVEMVVGILGILKAGGAYVPLDPEYPTERLSFMLEDAQIRVLLTQQQLVQKLPEHTEQLVCLDSDWEKIALECSSNPLNTAISTNLAYVIYTSGSTGKPKGVLVNHSNVVRLFAATNWYNFNSDDIWTMFHSYAFDFSVWEIWGALLYGGRLVVVPYLVTRSPESFHELLSNEGVTILNQTPSAFRQLIQAEQSIATVGALNLRLVIFGGEALEIKSLQPWFERHGDKTPQLVNMYGITETTVHVTHRPLISDDLNRTASIIGRPIPDLQVYLLDEHLQPVPIGVRGEMYVGGAGVARGYLNRPELTQQRFISNPFAARSKARLYKTGDLARYLPNGELEYLGRIDNQVKIRGFRIELGEIEATLSQHADIHSVVVIARVDNPGDQRLVAYVVPQLDVTPTISSLRQFLQALLPDYMVPNAIVILESLPMTPNGKIDRRALPAPSNSSGSDTFVSPRNTVELQLVQIWSKILKVDDIGVKDNFFDKGGHSLLAVYLMAQIQQQFGKDIPLATLFQHPTIEQLATVVQLDGPAIGYSPLVPIQSIGSKPPLFCLPGAGGNPFYLYNLARCLGPDQPFYSFQLTHLQRELAPITRVEDLAAQYIQAIQAVQPQGPYFLAGHSFGGKVVFEMAQQLLSQGQVVALVAILDTTAPHAKEKHIDDLWDDATWLIEIAKTLKTVFAKDLDLDAEPLQSLAPDEQLQYVLEYLKMIDIVPYYAEPTYLKQLLQAFKADANAEYVPQQTQKLPITLLRAREANLEEPVNAQSELLQDSAWGWSAFSSVPVDVQFVSGNHVTMMTQPHVQVLAERLNACIHQAMNKMGLPETLN